MMKKKNITCCLGLLLSIGSFLSNCDDKKDVHIVLDTVEDQMNLSVNAQEIILSEEHSNDPAITFSWNQAQPRKNNGTITYYFKLGLSGLSTTIEKMKIDDGIFEFSISHMDLNILVHSQFDVPYGSMANLEAEIIAESNGDYFVKPEISKVEFNVTTFTISPVNLYLIGTANPAGTEIERGILMTEIVEDQNFGNNYRWEGELKEGTFKFVNSITEDEGSWSKGKDETELVENSSSSDSDLEFTVTRAGWYSILINKMDNEIIHGYKGFKIIWGVGLGIGIPWACPFTVEFDWDPRIPNIFTLECTVQAKQDFKLPYDDQSNEWSTQCLRPFVVNADIWSDNRVFIAPPFYSPDLKWLTTEEQAGDCILTIDALSETISLVKKN